MSVVVEGFGFNDFCLRCQKVTENKIVRERGGFSGICNVCNEKRPITDVNQVYYPKTGLWVTRFKIGNLPGVVTGKLLEAVK